MTIVERKRLMKHMTQSELAKATGIPLSNLMRIERGETKFPRVETVKKLAAALGFTLEEFYREAALL